MPRPGPATESALATLGLIVAVGVLLSVVTIVPSGTVETSGAGLGTASAGNGGVGATTQPGHASSSIGPAPSGPQTSSAPIPGTVGTATVPSGRPGLSCAAGSNGGATDTGVTATSVLFGATTVTDGSGASFLAPMDDVMSAVADKVNHAGGICGRQLKLTLANDSWQENLGEQYIQNFVEGSHVFGLAVNPDSEGLYGASRSGYLDRQQVPVVGTGGQTSQEYTDPWIWPVGTATISQMHIMVQDAYNRGARGFGIVFDAKYHFGVEGAYAYDQAVKRLTGHDVPGYSPSLNACSEQFCGIQPAQSSYTSTAQQFDTACYQSTPGHTGSCQFVAYLLEPDLALSWLSSEAGEAEYGYGAAEPMFDRQAFADQCTSPNCNGQSGFDVWTGFQPPEGSYAGQPAEVAYVNLMHTVDGSFDVDNQFAEGAYVGMNLLVTALQATGPDLTRQRLAAVLNATSYSSGLAPALTYRSGHHFANAVAMAWKLDYSSGHFTGFSAATGFEKDPWLGQDIQAPGQ